MAQEPTEPISDGSPPDPEHAVNDALDTAGRAAKDIGSSPDTDEVSSEALDAAVDSVNQVRQTAAAAMSPNAASPPKPDAAGAAPFRLQDLAGTLKAGKKETLDLLSDVQLNVRIELGRTRMYVEDVLQLGDGAVVELDKLAGDPVDVFVNDRHVARGEVLVLNDNFCVRINEILDPGAERAG